MNAGFQTTDYLVFGVYALIIVIIGLYISRFSKEKSSSDYFLAGRSLSWWAIGASLIAANISAEQFIGMSGSGFRIGIGIAAYEWIAAATLILVAKYLLPIMIEKRIYTMPQLLNERYGHGVSIAFSIFFLLLYLFVNLTSVAWLGALAMEQVLGIPMMWGVVGLLLFSGLYSIYGGLKAVVWTDIIQVVFLIGGGLVAVYFALKAADPSTTIMADGSAWGRLAERLPYDPRCRQRLPSQHDNPRRNGRFRSGHRAAVRHFEGPAGTRAAAGVDLGHQYRLLGVQSVYHSERIGGPFAARSEKRTALRRLPETPHPADRRHSRYHGLCAVHQSPPDPRIAGFDHHGRQCLSVAVEELHADGHQRSGFRSPRRRDRFFACQHDQQHGHDFHHGHLQTADCSRSLGKTVGKCRRMVAFCALFIAMAAAKPLLGGLDQAFQYIQEYSGYVYPGVTVVFSMGLLWKKATNRAALWTSILTIPVGIALKFAYPNMGFVLRMSYAFIVLVVIAVTISLLDRSESVQDDTSKIAGRRSMISASWVLLALAALCIFAGILFSERWASYHFDAIYMLGTLFGFIGIILYTNGQSHTRSSRAYSIGGKTFDFTPGLTVGALGIVIILTAIYAVFW